MVGLLNYGMGNLRSVQHALEMVGADVQVLQHPEDLARAERLVLPGVGTFGACMQRLRTSGFVEALSTEVRHKGKPLLGICVGMQVLARASDEMGQHQGLGWVPAVVQRLSAAEQGLPVPHVGWNDIAPQRPSPLFNGIRKETSFYFMHSYCVQPDTPDLLLATCDYGSPFAAALLQENIVACQFHPEKSQHNGLAWLANFLTWNP
ncbi:MAG: imidazole glycerol phosphate synthase subunit HisH [Candidatus Tectimicrobiota bacterium]